MIGRLIERAALTVLVGAALLVLVMVARALIGT